MLAQAASEFEPTVRAREVADLAVWLGEILVLNVAQQQRLFYGATLHDIGKLGLNQKVLRKPGGLNLA